MTRTSRALALARAVRRARTVAPARVSERAPAPSIALDRVGRELKAAPALRMIAVALVVATSAHAMAGAFGLGLRTKRSKARHVTMAVAPPEDDMEQPPPPEPAPTSTSASAAPASTSAAPALAAPGPVVPGLNALAGVGGEGAMALGGPAAGSARAPTSAVPERAPVEPTPPRVVRRTAPQYPKAARAKGTTGRVVLELLVDERGTVADVRVLEAEPPGVFDDAARAAARGWRFEPARRGSERVRAWVRQSIRFELE